MCVGSNFNKAKTPEKKNVYNCPTKKLMAKLDDF